MTILKKGELCLFLWTRDRMKMRRLIQRVKEKTYLKEEYQRMKESPYSCLDLGLYYYYYHSSVEGGCSDKNSDTLFQNKTKISILLKWIVHSSLVLYNEVVYRRETEIIDCVTPSHIPLSSYTKQSIWVSLNFLS
jgi:hypothetical protein